MTAPADVSLRPVEDPDLDVFFAHQQDPVARRQAAFVHEDSSRAAFDAHWVKIRAKPTVTIRTILAGGEVAGHLASFMMFDTLEVTYWLGREHQGKGVATRALALFLAEVTVRPIGARVAHDNAASSRVLEKCGFRLVERGKYVAHARGGAEIEELVYRLDGRSS